MAEIRYSRVADQTVRAIDASSSTEAEELRYIKSADQTVRAVDANCSTEEEEKPDRKSILWQIYSLAFGCLWLAPAVFLLCINFTGHVVGPSIGCLRASCRIDFHKTTQIQKARELAEADKNALAVLQLAAKVLDAWLLTIAGSLVYSTLRLISGRGSTSLLPVGFLHAHMELADLRCLLKLFWDRFRDVRSQKESMGGRVRKRLYIFIFWVASVCIISNLMGPAGAVLMIPSLQWMDVNEASNLWLVDLQSADPPRGDKISPSCTPENLTAGKYSCMTSIYGATSDYLAAAAVATDSQIFRLQENNINNRAEALLMPPILQEGNVSFTVNISDYVWVALRQSIRNISLDLMDWDRATTTTLQQTDPNYPDSHLFNRSLDSRLLRRGPTIGQQSVCTINAVTEFPLTDDQLIRCYPSRDNITTCIPAGSGWSDDVSQASSSFTIIDLENRANVSVTIHSASASLTLTDSAFDCATTNQCNWTWASLFPISPSLLPPGMTLSGPAQISQYTSLLPNSTSQTPSSILCHSKSILGFANYILNPSPFSNILRLVDINLDDETSDAIAEAEAEANQLFIHPDWHLAAWTVNQNGTVPRHRACARRLITAFQTWIAKGPADQAVLDFATIHRFISLQALSLIPFSTTPHKPADESEASRLALTSKGMVQVWKYGIESRSAKFGVVVTILGCVIVVLRTGLYWVYKEDVKDATEIIVLVMRRNAPPAADDEMEGQDEEKKQEFPIIRFNNRSRVVSFHG